MAQLDQQTECRPDDAISAGVPNALWYDSTIDHYELRHANADHEAQPHFVCRGG
jgi:hypothetical protein